MLCTWGPAQARPIVVGLTLFNGVQIVAPELWQLVSGANGLEYVTVKLSGAGASSAKWEVQPDASGECHLLLNWQAVDPMHASMPYDRELTVVDLGGAALPARSGSTNPSTTQCQIGPTPPNWSSVQETISVW